MKISLVTITMNDLSGLQRTVASLMHQSYVNTQYIIVDGKSTDGTQEYLKTLPERFLVIEAEPKGVYNAINEGIKRATGDVVGILNSGDVFNSGCILHLVAQKFVNDEALQYIYGDIHYMNDHYDSVARYYSGKDCSFHTLKQGFAPPHPSLYMTRKLIKRVGLYNERYKTAGDFEMFLRLFGNAKIKGAYVPLDMVEMAPGGISSTWKNRLYTNNAERKRAFTDNGYKVSLMQMFAHYYYIFKGTIWHKRNSLEHTYMPQLRINSSFPILSENLPDLT
jgi:glycosyltransferase